MVNTMKTKNVSAFILAIIMICCFVCSFGAACFQMGGATFVTLNKKEATLYVGDMLTLTAETDQVDAEIVWTSDATHVATVNGGVVTAVAAGEATIKACCGDVREYCDIIVLNKPEYEPKPEPVFRAGNLSDVYSNYFFIGAAVQTSKLASGDYGELINHFNSITAENNMKWKNIVKSKGVYNFNQFGDSADTLIAWAKQNGVGVRGHTLLWYKSMPMWLHDEFDGKGYTPDIRAKAFSYIDEHIEKVMEYFGDDVYAWDVVNEALFNSVDQSNLVTTNQNPYGNIWRTNDGMNKADSDWVDWYKICGSYDYIAKAFIKAGEVRTQNNLEVELYYNDYALHNPYKRQACLNLLQMLRDNNAPIDGIGMQAHYKLEEYEENRELFLKNFEDSVKAFIEAGVDIQITELDIRFEGELTERNEYLQAEMYGEIFRICRKYAKTEWVEHGITSVTTWGVYDGCNGAWGKDKYPLIFGSEKTPKQAYYEIATF